MVETAGVALRTYIDWNTQNQGRGLTTAVKTQH